jgi:hypothetical protein
MVAVVLTNEILFKVDMGLKLGWSIRQVALFSGLGPDTLAAYLKVGKIVRPAVTLSNRKEVEAKWWWLKTKQGRLAQNKNRHPVSLRPDYLFFLYLAQGSTCFYTGNPVLFTQDKQLSLSIDRVDQSKGYVEGNVVITNSRINRVKLDASLQEMAEWMPGWFRRIQFDLPVVLQRIEDLYIKYESALTSPNVSVRSVRCEAIDYQSEDEGIFSFS